MGDDQYERSLGDDDASYTTATPMWTAFMTEVVNGIPHGELPVRRPQGIHPRVVEYMSGEGPRSTMLYFKDR
jgi:penicillin-binding protein 1A